MKIWRKPEITKIKLNPEQAVLSCCENIGRDLVDMTSAQCHEACIGWATAIQSS
ncbi:MAG: hypothetical protein PHP69_01040 [Candidatus Omnitrophica bacterium]|jgi:hypothetical protein|nr:hypothetical protein [Candidatus Omnitrophota bacterium]MDD5081171.1 hypothetical protein [Candidatus Omnitrophota bacterium]MDD5441049.1 hypothetical protein [Candidatus Omnitrophota bacterium]